MAIHYRLHFTPWALTLAALIVASSPSASADTIQIFNTTGIVFSEPVVLSDLIGWSSPKQMGIKTVFLKPNDPTDDIILPENGSSSPVFGGPFTFIQSYSVSQTVTLNGKLIEERSVVSRVKLVSQVVIAFLTDGAGSPLFLDVDESVYTLPPPKGTLLIFANGATPGSPDWTLYNSFDESSGVLSGLYSGQAQVASTALLVEVNPVPEPATWLLVCSGLVLSVTIWKFPRIRIFFSSRAQQTRVNGWQTMCNLCWFLTLVLVVASPAFADAISLGSFTFNWNGTAPVSTMITLKISTGGMGFGKVLYDSFSLSVSGLNQNQAANNFLTLLKSAGYDAALNGTNSINVTVLALINNPVTAIFPVTGVRSNSNQAGFNAVVDGNVNLAFLAPMPSWVISFDPATVATAGGDLTLTVPTVGPLTTTLSSGSTADDATLALFGLLRGDGFPDVQCLNSIGVPELGCSDSTSLSFFLTPSGSPISTITELSFDGAGLDYGLTLPATVPEPASVYLVGFVAVIFVVKCKLRSRL